MKAGRRRGGRALEVAIVVAIVLGLAATAQATSQVSEGDEASAEATAEPGVGESAEAVEAAAAKEQRPDSSASYSDATRSEGDPLHEPWHYNTDYFFGLTRGLPESGASERSRPYWMVLTIPADVLTLPGAALAGLFG